MQQIEKETVNRTGRDLTLYESILAIFKKKIESQKVRYQMIRVFDKVAKRRLQETLIFSPESIHEH